MHLFKFPQLDSQTLNWIPLTNEEAVDELIARSHSQYILIFKHSTTCPISAFAKKRLEDSWSDDGIMSCHYLDLLKYRPTSNFISELLEVKHESPQAIVLHKGKVIYHDSHLNISIEQMLPTQDA